jgi:hypothetical protein
MAKPPRSVVSVDCITHEVRWFAGAVEALKDLQLVHGRTWQLQRACETFAPYHGRWWRYAEDFVDLNAVVSQSKEAHSCAANFAGRHHSEDTRIVMSMKQKKRAVVAIDKETLEVRHFAGIRVACKYTGAASSNVTACLKGRVKSVKGFYWCYADELAKKYA